MPSSCRPMSTQTGNDAQDRQVDNPICSEIRPVSMFERHLLTLSDHNRHRLFDYLPPQCLCLLSRTSTLVFHLVKFYERHAWSLPSFLQPWFPYPRPFLRLLNATCAVISGSQAFNFMDRRAPDIKSDLDIFVHVDAVNAIGDFLLMHGYWCKPRPKEDEVYFDFHDRMDLLFGDEERIQTCSDEKSIIDVIDFSQPQSHTNGFITMKVQLIVVAVDPICFILFRFHSTAVMNIITSRKAVSLFPRATFITRNSYVSRLTGNQKKIASWKSKYSARGFKIKDNFREPFPQDFRADAIIEARQMTPARSIAAGRHVDTGRKYTIVISQRRRIDPSKLADEGRFYSDETRQDRLRYFMPIEELFRDHVDTFTVMAFSEMSLHLYLTRRHGMLSKQQLKEITVQLFRAIDFIHSENLVHTNICPANIIFARPFSQHTRYSIGSGALIPETSLLSTEVRLCFYGDTRDEETMVFP
ncbi:hypothetical protein H1R20_g4519, partial [Candolleomyces eurysporus]